MTGFVGCCATIRRMRTFFQIAVAAAVVSLIACSKQQPTPPAAAFDTSIDTKQLMRWMIDPAAKVVFGAVASIVTDSGPLPGATEGSFRGAAAYFAMVNSSGGVCGRKITLLKGDDGLVAVPYYAWDHREPGEMEVWLLEE